MRHSFTIIELILVIVIVAIIAAVAIPRLLASRITANEMQAAAVLKSQVFPAQVQFQGHCYQDLDGDGIGEYGTLHALAGLTATTKAARGSITLLTGPLAKPSAWSDFTSTADPSSGVAQGYRYLAMAASETDAADATVAIWAEGAAAPTARANAKDTADNGERYWIAAGAPERYGETGRRAFLITNDGQVRSPATMAALSAFFGLTQAPAHGTPSTSSGILQGLHFTYRGTLGPLALTDLEQSLSSGWQPGDR